MTSGAFSSIITLVPVRPRRRGERRSLRTSLPGGASLRPGSHGFNLDTHTATPFNSATDAYELHPDIIALNDGTISARVARISTPAREAPAREARPREAGAATAAAARTLEGEGAAARTRLDGSPRGCRPRVRSDVEVRMDARRDAAAATRFVKEKEDRSGFSRALRESVRGIHFLVSPARPSYAFRGEEVVFARTTRRRDSFCITAPSRLSRRASHRRGFSRARRGTEVSSFDWRATWGEVM